MVNRLRITIADVGLDLPAPEMVAQWVIEADKWKEWLGVYSQMPTANTMLTRPMQVTLEWLDVKALDVLDAEVIE